MAIEPEGGHSVHAVQVQLHHLAGQQARLHREPGRVGPVHLAHPTVLQVVESAHKILKGDYFTMRPIGTGYTEGQISFRLKGMSFKN